MEVMEPEEADRQQMGFSKTSIYITSLTLNNFYLSSLKSLAGR